MILYRTDTPQLRLIEFDATIREDHQGMTTVSEYHVESGTNPADHARAENDRVTFDVVVTNTPIKVPFTQFNDAIGGYFPTRITVPSVTAIPKILPGVGLVAGLLPRGETTMLVDVLAFEGDLDRVGSVYVVLQYLQQNIILVNLESPLRAYTDMIITNLSTPRGPADGSSVTFTVSARAIRFVDSEIVAVSASAAKKKKTKGVKPGAETAEPLRSKAKGAAVKFAGATPTSGFTLLP